MRAFSVEILVLACLPWVSFWAWRIERWIVRRGRKLSDKETVAARLVGVVFPDRIRIFSWDQVPAPGFRWLQQLARLFGFDNSLTCGMAIRYGIFIRNDCAGDPRLILHECVHTAQYERFGSLAGFLRRYLNECLIDGYDKSNLEREARYLAAIFGTDEQL